MEGISLGPTGNVQGTYKFMSLLTGILVRSRSFVMLPIPSKVVKQVSIFAKNQQGDIIFADRSGNNTIEDLSTEEEGDANDDGHDGYSSGEDASGTDGDKSLVFDVDVSKGDKEVTDAVKTFSQSFQGQ